MISLKNMWRNKLKKTRLWCTKNHIFGSCYGIDEDYLTHKIILVKRIKAERICRIGDDRKWVRQKWTNDKVRQKDAWGKPNWLSVSIIWLRHSGSKGRYSRSILCIKKWSLMRERWVR